PPHRYTLSLHDALPIFRPPQDQVRLEEELKARPDEGAERTGVRHRTKDGRVLDVYLVARPIEFAGRRARLVLARDVTAQRTLERSEEHTSELQSRFDLV